MYFAAGDAGLNVCRTWAFNDGGHRALQIRPFSYDEEVFQWLDFVISEERKQNMRLILSLCNTNWEDFFYKTPILQGFSGPHKPFKLTHLEASLRLCWDSRSRWNSGLKATVVGGSSGPAPNVNVTSFSGKIGQNGGTDEHIGLPSHPPARLR
ncbi:hypothetical protein EJB05_29906 [Eragrostis curvula]|uniref:Uncharacterized protein n=1 Tax=Eragrostis curvula TaxID=38414 RepID=A0A5J9UUS4_9POAL|nr:hypothetical protein EJB05_29906 [Eragrostis curvula]